MLVLNVVYYCVVHLQSAVLRLHVVRLSVTLLDCDHIGWKSWKLIARTISPTPSLFVAQRPSTYSQGRGTWGNFGETRLLMTPPTIHEKITLGVSIVW